MEYSEISEANAAIKTINIRGKEYAEVKERIKAFRKIEPSGSIETEIISLDGDTVFMKATVKDAAGNLLGTGHAFEKIGSTPINKTSYLENCETSAIGRALAFCGLGIDAGIASAEEVRNAKAQQAEHEQKPPQQRQQAKPQPTPPVPPEEPTQEQKPAQQRKPKSALRQKAEKAWSNLGRTNRSLLDKGITAQSTDVDWQRVLEEIELETEARRIYCANGGKNEDFSKAYAGYMTYTAAQWKSIIKLLSEVDGTEELAE